VGFFLAGDASLMLVWEGFVRSQEGVCGWDYSFLVSSGLGLGFGLGCLKDNGSVVYKLTILTPW
jgi:hypothetical protein